MMSKIHINRFENYSNSVIKKNGKIVSIKGLKIGDKIGNSIILDFFEANISSQIIIPFKEYNTDNQYEWIINYTRTYISTSDNILSLQEGYEKPFKSIE